MAVRQLDLGRDGRAILSRADQAGVAARAERQAQRIEQDRLAGAGLAGQDSEPGLELELQSLDQHDIVNGELPQHVREIGAAIPLRALTPASLFRARARLRIACRTCAAVCLRPLGQGGGAATLLVGPRAGLSEATVSPPVC